MARQPAGEPVRNFTLPDVTSGQDVRLSDFRGRRPVVLIFGSPGRGTLRDQAGRLEDLFRAYRGRAAFLFIALREAPALPPVGPPADSREQTRQAMTFLGLSFPCLLDTRYGDTTRAYRAWPQRLAIVGVNGRLALDAGCGLPEGWDLREVEAWLMDHPREASEARRGTDTCSP
jgi:hypothetical protein